MQMMTTTVDPERQQAEREKTYEEKQRLQARQASRRARADEMADSVGLTADFLDANDEEDLDGNLGALRRAYKDQKKRGAGRAPMGRNSSGRRTGAPKRRRQRYNDDDDEGEEEEDDDDDEDDDEGDDGEPGEMDGFIVGDDEDEESDSGGSD
jgi:hypothetical protein